jgi:hypothetical protein
MIMNQPPSLLGVAVTLVLFGILGYTVSTFETLIGPLIQYQGEYSKDTSDLNCSYIYLLFTAFGITGLLALSLMQKIENTRKVNPMVHKFGPCAQLASALALGVIACGILVPSTATLTLAQFLIAFAFLSAVIVMGTISAHTMYLRVVGKPDAFHQNVASLFGALARCLSPLLIVDSFSTGFLDVFWLPLALYGLGLLLLAACKNSL